MKNILLYITTVLIWGSTWFAIKFQLGNVDPMISISCRFLLASAILLIYCIISGRKLKFNRQEHLFIFLQGLFTFSISYWVVYIAEIQLKSGLVAVICSSLIFLNILNRSIFLKFKINLPVLFGAFIGICGIVLIYWREIKYISFSDKNFVAMLLSFFGTAIFSFGNIIVERNIKNNIPVIQANAYSMGYGAVIMLLLALITDKNFDFDVRLSYMFSLLYLSIFGSVVAFYCYFTLIGNIGSDRASYGPVIVPVLALLISTLFENYNWSEFAVTGIILLLIGNIIISLPKTD